ncbi:hypothetical protein TNCV_4731241 [Trichonephila clavipes]|nr:hypothetical protein TNCV_4731241 [Trichonephila clavipes]
MKYNDVIEQSSSSWASPITLVKKKDGSKRFCVDYRRLNDITKKDSYPLPRIDDTPDTLAGNTWFSTLDIKSGYCQIEVHPHDKEKTAFTTGQGLMQFKLAKKLCAFLGLPFLSKLAFRNQERKLLKATERVAQEDINAALSEIKGSNSFTKCGISIDGTWQRRGYSSLNGCVSAISVDTGKILDIEVMTQYCHICAKGNSQSSKHVCSNYKGSAGNMEVVGAYRIFERSNVRNVQYNEYYGDGDSKGYESVKNFYGINTVTKLECI